MKWLLWVVLAAGLTPCYADLATVQSEPNLEKRSDKALANADLAMEAARKAYQAPDLKAFEASLNEVRESVDLSYKSLQDTGKAARRSPKYFKRAELKLRALLKRLENLKVDVALDDRAQVESLAKHVNDVHDQILHEIMTKRH
jgi:hypothetical protein